MHGSDRDQLADARTVAALCDDPATRSDIAAPPTRPPSARDVVADLAEHARDAARWARGTLVAGPSCGPWDRVGVVLPRSALRFGTDGATTVAHHRVPPGVVVFHLADAGRAPLCAGRELRPRRIAVHGPGAHCLETTHALGGWIAFLASTDLIEEAAGPSGAAWLRDDPLRCGVRVAGSAQVAALRRRLALVRRRIRFAQESYWTPQTRESTEREVARAFVEALEGARKLPSPEGAARHGRVLVDVLTRLDSAPDDAIALSDLCSRAGVSARTLRRIFREFYRLPPIRYLRLRRLNQARDLLRRGSPPTVTATAVRFGFFELGRFAVEYRRLFGECPSKTLAASR